MQVSLGLLLENERDMERSQFSLCGNLKGGNLEHKAEPLEGRCCLMSQVH